MGAVEIPATIATGCAELDMAWATYAGPILNTPGVMIPDTEDDLNWHAFLGHSLDMQGWRAAEFVGVDELTRNAPGFIPLRERGIGIRQLGELWEITPIREHLLHGTAGLPVEATMEVLAQEGGEVGASFAEAYRRFPWRKAHAAVRAYLQNSAALAEHDYSFRSWLEAECEAMGVSEFPPMDFRVRAEGSDLSVEWELVRRLEHAFYQVGPTLAPYIICDWQLWLWQKGQTGVFEAFKPDLFHEQFADRYGNGVIPVGRKEFIAWWLALYPELPPRLINECIWLAIERGLGED
jgi:hypothetical protein